jgi:hypothetical protein
MRFAFVFSLCSLCIPPTSLLAQVTQTGSIRGTVVDPSGLGIPGATVSIANSTRLVVRSLSTSADGTFVFQSVPNGTYEVSAEAAGFNKVVRTQVILRSGENAVLDLELKPATVTTSVDVTEANAPLVNSVNANINTVLSNTEVMNTLLPANDAVRLAAFLPGASSEYVHNGQSANQNVIVVDGSNDGDEFIAAGTWKFHPPSDSVAEFRVTQNGYTADFGRASGTRLEFVTKTGTNELHGTAYWFHRQPAFNARNWGQTVRSMRRFNDVGYTLGGPAVKEKIYFFWTSYYRRSKTPQSGFRTWPTRAQAAGDFSAWLNPPAPLRPRIVRDPLTNQPFPGNIIPPERLNRNAVAYLNLYYPLVADPFALNNNDFTADDQLDQDDFYAPRVDFRVSNKLNMYVRGMYNRRDQSFADLAPQMRYSPDQLRIPGRTFSSALAGTYIFSPSWFADFQFTVSRTDGSWQQKDPESALLERIPGWNTRLLFPGGNVLGQLPQLNLGGGQYTNIGRAVGRSNKWGQGNLSANFNRQSARHTLKFGVEEVYRGNTQTGYANTFGTYSFDGFFTGDAVADLLLGLARSYTQMSSSIYWRAAAWQHGWYAQDEWRVNRKLVLTYGIRWEADGAYKAVAGQQWSNWRPERFDVSKAHRVDPATGVIIGPVNNMNGIEVVDVVAGPPLNNWAPRFSVAYAPTASSLVFRAGYGLFYDHQQGPTTRLPGNPPFRFTTTLLNVSLDDPTGGTPDVDRPTTLTAVSLPFRTPRAHKWSFSVQRDLGGFLVEGSYVGARNTHQALGIALNQPAPNADVLARRLNIEAIRPYYGFSSITQTQFVGNGRYDSLQAQVRRPLRKGLFFQASYTFSKLYADGGTTDPLNRAYDAGRTGGDFPHIFSFAGNWEPQFFLQASPLVKTVLHGWSLSTTLRLISGAPLAAAMATDTTGIGRTVRPNWTGSVAHPRTMAQWFDGAAFSAPPPLVFGNSPVDAVRGPGQRNWDLGVFRTFALREKWSLQYRFEAYNALNHFNLNNPGMTFGTPNFGVIVGKSNPRNLQMGLRLIF